MQGITHLWGKVEKHVLNTYFAKILGECKTLPDVFDDIARMWLTLWNSLAPTITLPCPASKVSSIAHMKSPVFMSTSFALIPNDMGL